jgi:hypothetical protein
MQSFRSRLHSLKAAGSARPAYSLHTPRQSCGALQRPHLGSPEAALREPHLRSRRFPQAYHAVGKRAEPFAVLIGQVATLPCRQLDFDQSESYVVPSAGVDWSIRTAVPSLHSAGRRTQASPITLMISVAVGAGAERVRSPGGHPVEGFPGEPLRPVFARPETGPHRRFGGGR